MQVEPVGGKHFSFVCFGLGPQRAGTVNKAPYLNTGFNPDYGFLIEVFSVRTSKAVLELLWCYCDCKETSEAFHQEKKKIMTN